MNRRLFFCTLYLLLVISCNIFPAQTISPTLPTASPFSLPPTWTPQPTQTDLPKATEMVWTTYTAVPPIDLASNLSETSQSKWANYIPLASPNGDWTAYYNWNEIRIVKGEDNLWTLPCELFKQCIYIMAVQWSRDSKYLYFGASTFMGGSPEGDEFPMFSSAGRINVRTGEWERLFPDPGYYFNFAVSPDGKYVALVERRSSEQSENRSVLLHVLNFETRQRTDYSADGLEGGNIVWSPYKPRFVFLTRDPDKGSFIVYFDVEAEVLRYVLKEATDKLSIGAWLENNLVTIYRISSSGSTSFPFYLNPFTGELSFGTATPTP